MHRGRQTAEDAAWFGAELARAGIDFLSLSRGGKFEDAKQPKVGWAGYPVHRAQRLRVHADGALGRAGARSAATCAATRAVREAVRAAGCRTPVVLSGGISTFEQAEALLASGEADIVAAARQTLADPDWFRKLRLGRGDEVRRCVFTNYCEGLDQEHKQVTCKLWDHLDLEGDESPLAPPTAGGAWSRRRGSPPPAERSRPLSIRP